MLKSAIFFSFFSTLNQYFFHIPYVASKKGMKFLSILEIFSKGEVQTFNVCACSTRNIKLIDFFFNLLGKEVWPEKLIKKLYNFGHKKNLQKCTLNIQIFDML
jgi:hypothetical protein